ncbi:MAG TPA: DUF2905 domain-containing protein [Syntrophorhabdaceae bacterium]|nr:DUF2905 domain-containing protein [Syntrophorhabdaceae bacterium]HOL05079.1 DUF2905 domain-containing protein [Syntrophorhabdaceae bacterium]HON85341.1 DUF2905 domain-containing protein [Syntrophorhabdaceae bacterium]HOT41574.1 DUF2905 domain-containing protein [Syntrophorhabdaceae bacterium]HPC66922.1 DUF2905 domain-containing protein [Syntrophorhabdaceae bacterium]
MIPGFGKMFIIIGVLFIIIGLAFMFGDKIPYIGRLPGDIHIKKENFSFYFPITTSIIISIILTILFSIFRK